MSLQQTSTNLNQSNKNQIQKKSIELYLPPSSTKKKTLVLDLDETLVHSQFGPFNIPSDVVINIEIEKELHEIHVLIRPGVKEFLEKMSKLFEIVIFTASISKYAGPLLDILDKEKFCSFRLFREHCTLLNSSFVKDLKKLGRDLKDIIIVDNSPLAYLLNNDNGLPILTWFDNKNDQELYKICPVLEFLSEVPDVREYISKIVVNNEISYSNANKIINEYNEKFKKKNNENEIRESKISMDNNKNGEYNFEINDGSRDNLAVINNQDKNQQQININIINNNITNYIYDNNQQINDENISDNIIKNDIDKKIPSHSFNPNSIIASVDRTEIIHKFSPLTQLIKENKNKTKNSNSTNKIYNKKINLKSGFQNKTNNYFHKKSESTGYGYKLKSKKKNFDEFDNNNKNSMKKNNPVRNNTNYNYNSKSQNKKEQNIKSNGNKTNKSAKILLNVKKQFYLNDKNIAVNKKNILKDSNDKNGIRFINDGNHTTVHNRQKIQLNINNIDKTYRNYNRKNKTNTSNNLLHSIDLNKNEIAMYYHNEQFPFAKQENNINNGGLNYKNRNINKFLKNNNLKNKKSSSIDNEINKNIKKENKYDHIQRFNNIKLNNDFKYTNNKNKEKNIIISHTSQEGQKKPNQKKENMPILNTNNILKEHNKNNSSININSNVNINLTHSAHFNPHSGSMKNIMANEKEEKKDKKMQNVVNKRPKSSNLFKKNKYANKRKQIRRNASGRYAKQINMMKYNIIEILERRGIAKTNRIKYFKDNAQNNNINNNINNIENNKDMNNIMIEKK